MVLLGVGCAHDAEPAPSLNERFAALAEGADIMRECPERIWPGYSWRGKQVVFYERSTRAARYYRVPSDDGAAQTGELAYESLPESHLHGAFSSGELAGMPTLFVALDDRRDGERQRREGGIELGIDAALPFAFHEAFHAFGQANWQVSSAGRPSDFPLRWEPRYLRLQLLRALQAALRGEAGLGAAKYWSDRYQAEHAQDRASIAATDAQEGSAEYVEVVSTWLAREGCSVSEAELESIAGAELDAFAPYLPIKSFESYSLGAASGLLLRLRTAPSWQQAVASGQAPVDVLLASVVAEPQADDEARAERVRSAITPTNERLKGVLTPFVTMFERADAIRLAVPIAWQAGAFSAGDSLRLVEVEGKPVVYPELSATYLGAHGERIEVSNVTMLIDDETVCGPAFVLVLPADAVAAQADGTYRVTAPGITATPLRATLREAAGVRSLCVE